MGAGHQVSTVVPSGETIDMTSDTSVSVFGATGFIGSRFCERAHLTCIPMPRDARAPETADIVYFISTIHNFHVFTDIHLDVQTNLGVLLDVLKNLKPGHSVFNFISSWFVYGETELPAHEESVCRPKGFYSITKHAAEELLISYCRTFDIDYRILRLCNVYGPGDRGVGKQKNALQHLINCMAAHEPIGLYHDGYFYRDYLHVDDVVRAIETCIRKAPRNVVINIGSGEKVLFRQLIETAHEMLGSRSEITDLEPPQFHTIAQVKDFYMNVDKLRGLEFWPTLSLHHGLENLCQISKEHSATSSRS